ncbi:Uncharacterised protein [Mycolicibacterium phlei]|nr:Uncharacterised protein [Mycolicibacterium phlei]
MAVVSGSEPGGDKTGEVVTVIVEGSVTVTTLTASPGQIDPRGLDRISRADLKSAGNFQTPAVKPGPS